MRIIIIAPLGKGIRVNLNCAGRGTAVASESGDKTRAQRVVSLLLLAADHELLTHRVYRRLWEADGFDRLPKLHGLSRTASDEDWEHYHGVLACAKRLASDCVDDMRKASDIRTIERKRNSVVDLLYLLRKTEKHLVQSYHEICRLTIERDYRTFDLSFRYLTENADHQQCVSRLLTIGWDVQQRGARSAGFIDLITRGRP